MKYTWEIFWEMYLEMSMAATLAHQEARDLIHQHRFDEAHKLGESSANYSDCAILAIEMMP